MLQSLVKSAFAFSKGLRPDFDPWAQSLEEFDRVRMGAEQIAASPSIAGVTMVSKLEMDFPPWPHLASTDHLLARANRLYAELGRSLTGISVGSSAEYADFATFTPRTYLLTRLLMDLGHSPPE